MTIDSMLKLANTCNVVHFPQGVIVQRTDNGYSAGILTKDTPHFPFTSTNKTADGALDDLKNYVRNAAKKLAQSKHNEAVSFNGELQAILGETP